MAEVNQAQPGQLMDIGTVAASNIILTLGLPASSLQTVKQAIRDEITAMSSHFTLAVADAQESFDNQVAEIKSTFGYAQENWFVLAGAAIVCAAVGFLFGQIL